jgi:hypothetical protein
VLTEGKKLGLDRAILALRVTNSTTTKYVIAAATKQDMDQQHLKLEGFK